MKSVTSLVKRFHQVLLASALFAASASAAQITIENSAETFLRSDLPTGTSGGSSSFMFVGQTAGDKQFHGLLTFNLANLSSLLPENARIDSVSLQMAIEAKDANSVGSAISIQLYQLTQTYDEGSASWNNRASGSPWSTPGGTYNGSTLLGQTTVPTKGEVGATYLWNSANLLELFEQVYASGGELNLLLKKADDSVLTRELVRFVTRENATYGSTLSPRLVIDYTIVPEPSAVSLGMGVAVLALLIYRRSRKR